MKDVRFRRRPPRTALFYEFHLEQWTKTFMGVPIKGDGDTILLFNGLRCFDENDADSIDTLTACVSHESIHCALIHLGIQFPAEREGFDAANATLDQPSIFGYAQDIDNSGISVSMFLEYLRKIRGGRKTE